MTDQTEGRAAVAESAIDRQLIVEDVVSALTCGVDESGEPSDLGLKLQRAAEEFDRRTADAFGRALLDSLCEDPANLRQLEALLILGLAHPDVLRKHRISLAVEGRRLAVLLERSGEIERARAVLELLANNLPNERTIDHELAGILRRSGNTEELIQRYIARAEECAEHGRISEAIPWLQEVLLLDRTRRDVARMIRDLRYQEADRQARSSKRNRIAMLVLLLSAAGSGIYAREYKIHEEYKRLTPFDPSSPQSMYQRLGELEDLIDDKRVWAGMMNAVRERDTLQSKVADHERREARRAHEEALEAQAVLERAEASRQRGIMHAEQGEHERALGDFERALKLAPPDWEHRERVEADVRALQAMSGGDS